MIFVTNNNEFFHADKFDGQEYIWEPGEKHLIDEDAAAHMFGYGRADKTENLIRLGWQREEGVMKLANFVFTSGRMVEDVSDEGDEQEESPKPKPFRKKTTTPSEE
jgi:hypothetical protein